jgi:hypothetical protein
VIRRLPPLALATAALLAGCGSSSGNGVASKTPDGIVAAAKAAADTGRSAHVAGTIQTGGQTIALDLQMLAGVGARGTMQVNGTGVQLIRNGSALYLNGGPAFWRQFGNSGIVGLLSNRWLKTPTTAKDFAAIEAFTDLHKLLDTALASHGVLTKGRAETVNGQKVIAVNDTTKGGTLDVATTGRPYPMRLGKPGVGGGEITFDRWDAPVTLTVPAGAIDIPHLSGP